MDFNSVQNINYTRIEARTAIPYQEPPKIPFGLRLTNAVSRFVAPVATAVGAIFPPALALGATAYGTSALTGRALEQHYQYHNYHVQQQNLQAQAPLQYVGYNPVPSTTAWHPASVGARSVGMPLDTALEILNLRQDAMTQSMRADFSVSEKVGE